MPLNFLYLNKLAKVETEQLQNQIEFLQKANDSIASSFQSYVQSIYYLIFTTSIVLGTLAAIATFLFWKSLQEATKSAKKIAEKEVYRVVGESIEREVRVLKRSIEREQVIGNTRVNYLLVDGDNKEPEICQLIRKREFRDVRYFTSLENINFDYEVLIVDFFNQDFPEEKRKEIITRVISLYRKSPFKFILVVYVSSAPTKKLSIELQELIDKNGIYSTPANSPFTLMGRVIDAAQMSYALR